MAEKGADYHLITRLEEIAWLYNLRGSDVAHTPVFFAFALISRDEDRLYVLDENFTGKKTRPYFDVFRDLGELPPDASCSTPPASAIRWSDCCRLRLRSSTRPIRSKR